VVAILRLLTIRRYKFRRWCFATETQFILRVKSSPGVPRAIAVDLEGYAVNFYNEAQHRGLEIVYRQIFRHWTSTDRDAYTQLLGNEDQLERSTPCRCS